MTDQPFIILLPLKIHHISLDRNDHVCSDISSAAVPKISVQSVDSIITIG